MFKFEYKILRGGLNMCKKLVIGNPITFSDGTIVGEQVGSFNGRIVIEDNKGNQKIGIYGCTDSLGKFHEYCKNTKLCGQRCFSSESPSCRYNRKFQGTAGYYTFAN